MITPRSETIQTTETRVVTGPFRYFRILSVPAGAAVSMATMQEGKKSDFTPYPLGVWVELQVPSIDCYMISTVTGIVTYEFSETDKKKTSIASVTITGTVTVLDQPGNILQGTTDVTLVSLAAAVSLGAPVTTDVRAYIISLDSAAPGPVRIGGNGNCSATKGFQLMPGAYILIPISSGDPGGAGPLGFNPNAVNVTVNISQVAHS